MKIVIIEDEKLTARDLARTIAGISPDADIEAMLHSVSDAVEYLNKHTGIDLIFSDIQLGDGLSFEIFEKTHNQIPVIFCTAYNENALEAFKTVGIDYLVKPFSKATVGKAPEKFRRMKETFAAPAVDFSPLMELLKNQRSAVKIPSIIIQQGGKIIPLDGATIAFFYIDNDSVFASTFDNKKHLLSKKLDILEEMFAPVFFRANRQFLINRKAVKDASHFFNRKVVVNLTVPCAEQITVGKVKVTAFIEWLAKT